jgi:hypothetical protein
MRDLRGERVDQKNFFRPELECKRLQDVKGKRTKRKGLGNVLDKTKTNKAVVPIDGFVPAPARYTKVLRKDVEPRTATDHTPVAVPIVGPNPR